MSEQTRPNVYQRLVKVAKVVGQIEATGQNQYKGKAMSVEDVEDAIREALAENGVVTRWSYGNLQDIGEGKLWLADITVKVVNADNPEDFFEDRWIDIGGNPTAATSFGVKGYYRRLFHLAKEEEEQGTTPRNTTQPRSYGQQRERKPAPPEAIERADRIKADLEQKLHGQPEGKGRAWTQLHANTANACAELAKMRGKRVNPDAALLECARFLGMSADSTNDLTLEQLNEVLQWASTNVQQIRNNSGGAVAEEPERKEAVTAERF